MKQTLPVLLLCAALGSCSGSAQKKKKFPPCPEYQSAMCPYGWREVLDTNRNCLQYICTETQGIIPYEPIGNKEHDLTGALHRGGCDLEDREWILEISIEAPREKALAGLRAALKRSLPAASVTCTRSGEITLRLSTADLRGLLGKDHVKLTCTRGAGNRVKATAWHAAIEPASYVPEAYRPFVKKIFINTDPKYDLYQELSPEKCVK